AVNQVHALERARLWEEMRHREQERQFDQDDEPDTADAASGERKLSRRGVLIAAAAVLAALGGATYYFLASGEPNLVAQKVWEEFNQDTPAAEQKYKGKFVRLTGIVRAQTAGKFDRFLFAAPADAKWSIELPLRPDQMKNVKAGLELTVRCRFG